MVHPAPVQHGRPAVLPQHTTRRRGCRRPGAGAPGNPGALLGEYFASASLSRDDQDAQSPSPSPARLAPNVRDPQLTSTLEEYIEEIVTLWEAEAQRRRRMQQQQQLASSSSSDVDNGSSSFSSSSSFGLPSVAASLHAAASAVLAVLDSSDVSWECDRLIPSSSSFFSSSSSGGPLAQVPMSDDPHHSVHSMRPDRLTCHTLLPERTHGQADIGGRRDSGPPSPRLVSLARLQGRTCRERLRWIR